MMLGGAVVALQSRKAQRRMAGDGARQLRRRGAGGDATAPSAHIDFHIHVDADGLGAGCLGQRLHLTCVVHQHADAGASGQLGEVAQFGVADDLVGHQHVADARVDEHRRLAHLLAANADSAQRHLPARDLRTLVAFAVRAQAHRMTRESVRHALQVALERIKVEDQRGGIDGVDRVARAGCFPGAHDGVSRSCCGSSLLPSGPVAPATPFPSSRRISPA